MQFRALKLFVFVLVLCCVNAKLFGSRSKTGTWGRSSKPKNPSPPISFNHPSPPINTAPRIPQVHHPAPHYTPTAPHLSPNKPIVHENHQQSVSPISHNDPYARQPPSNPHIGQTGGSGSHYNGFGGLPPPPSGVSVPTGYHSPPYPIGQPNHPHPNPGTVNTHPYPNPGTVNTHPIQPQIQTPVYSGSSTYPGMGGHHAPPPYTPRDTHPVPYPSHLPPPPYTPHGTNPNHVAGPPHYNYPPASTPFVPGGHTVYVVDSKKSSSGPGLGSVIAGGVAGGVAAGATNAIVDHAISSIFRPNSNHVHTYPSAPSVTTNNYYYGSRHDDDYSSSHPQHSGGNSYHYQSSPLPGGVEYVANHNPPMLQPVGTSTSGVSNNDDRVNYPPMTNGVLSKTVEEQPPLPSYAMISDLDIMHFTEELFDKQVDNTSKYIEDLNLQKRVNVTDPDQHIPDEAPEPLFKIKPELYSKPTVATLKALYGYYQRDGTKNETMSPERRSKENAFLDEIVKTPVMKRTLNWLVERKLVESDNYEQKDLLRRMWFTTFSNTSSGFERIFLSEKFGDNGLMGMQNWIYFAHLEAQNNVNYLGYVDNLSLSGMGLLVKLNYRSEGFTMQNATLLVGTSPELELALYTVCFHARPNDWCQVSIGGAKFYIMTHSFRYFGKDLIDFAFPTF